MGGDDDAELSPYCGVDHSNTDFLGCSGLVAGLIRVWSSVGEDQEMQLHLEMEMVASS